MTSHAVVTLSFTRPVHAHELRPADVFAFSQAPNTPLTAVAVKETVISSELTLIALSLPSRTEPMHLPANTCVRALRMVRTVSLPCLLCRKSQDVELDLPREGEPLSLVCAEHIPDLDELTEAE
ncbi:hypothetical protein ACFWPU_07040 [Streptomyces sp. NPDC058471]|uniref:hypothetical protein n=1 Tax=Streptomyces sp. NPDC058471 TaxID=3346516 RepID=UPI0036624CF1